MGSAEVFDAVRARLKAMCADEYGTDRLDEFFSDRGFSPSDLIEHASGEVFKLLDGLLDRMINHPESLPQGEVIEQFGEKLIALWCMAWQIGFMSAEEVAGDRA